MFLPSGPRLLKISVALALLCSGVYLFAGVPFRVMTVEGTLGKIVHKGERVRCFVPTGIRPADGYTLASVPEFGRIREMRARPGPYGGPEAPASPLIDPRPAGLLLREGGHPERMTLFEILRCPNGRDYLVAAGPEAIASIGPLAPVVYLGLYAIGTIVFFSVILMTVAGALAFGPWWGSLYALLGATLGATASFALGRWVARDAVERHLPGKLRALSARLEERGFLTILLLRLIPVCPYNILNYLCGVSRMRYRDYLLGGMIGMAPVLGLWVWASRGLATTEPADPATWLPILLVVLLVLVPYLWRRSKGKGKGGGEEVGREAPGAG